MSSKKIPSHLDHPIDNILIDIAEHLNPYFKNLNFTPNMITLLSLIFGIISITGYIYHTYIISGIMLFISYFFDCMDGNYARRYNMQSKFGDKLDHIKDWLVISFLIGGVLLHKKTSIKFKLISMFVLILLLLGSAIHTGCTEEYIRKHKPKNKKGNQIQNSDMIGIVSFCPNIEFLKKSRYLGTASFTIGIIIIIILHKYI